MAKFYINPDTEVIIQITDVDTNPSYIHWVKTQNRTIRMVCSENYYTCSECKKGDRPLKKFHLKVIDYPNKKEKEWEIGSSILSQMSKYSHRLDTHYLRVRRRGSGKETRYKVGLGPEIGSISPPFSSIPEKVLTIEPMPKMEKNPEVVSKLKQLKILSQYFGSREEQLVALKICQFYFNNGNFLPLLKVKSNDLFRILKSRAKSD